MNTRPKKTPEEMREYKRNWAREHIGLQGRTKNGKNQNTYKTHCVRGHELSGDNLVLKKTRSGETHRICRICRNAEARESARSAQAKYDSLQREDPVRWAAERRRRRSFQLSKIGWTLELFDKKWEEQEGHCAVCNKPLNLDVKHNGAKAHADHEHTEPPKPREILCGNCNVGLGNFQDNPELLRKAAAYVEKHK